MTLSFVNSAGCRLKPPKVSQRCAPPASVPTMRVNSRSTSVSPMSGTARRRRMW